MQTQQYRTNGAKGALLDEYERALNDFKQVIAGIRPEELTAVVDPEADDPNCRSVQTVLSHVVRSAFAYATYLRQQAGETIDFRPFKTCGTAAGYAAELDAALAFTEKTFEKYPGIPLEVFENEQKMRVRWGQLYDAEQLMEHAIVHILRHRRQIERFLLQLRS